MFKFIHAADVHLDSPLLRLGQYDDAPAEVLRTATRQAVARLVDLALEENIDFLLIAGDLYDGDWDDVRTGLFMVKQLSRLCAAGIPVFVIAGNHDAASRMTQNVPLPANVTFFSHRKPETQRLDALNVAIHGQSFGKQAVTENLARNYPPRIPGYFNIGLLHTSLDGREGHANYAPCSLDDLRSKGYDYWALGHIHQREIIASEPFIAFSGNLQGRHIRETGPKGAFLVTVVDGKMNAEFRPLDVVRWERLALDASVVASADELLDVARAGLNRLRAEHTGLSFAVRVEVAGESACHEQLMAQPAKWESDLRAIALDVGVNEIWIEKVRLVTRPAQTDSLLDVSDGPLAEVAQLVSSYLTDDRALDELAVELKDLRDKLPAELQQGPDALGLDSREWLRGIVNGIEPLLHERLGRRKTAAPGDAP